MTKLDLLYSKMERKKQSVSLVKSVRGLWILLLAGITMGVGPSAFAQFQITGRLLFGSDSTSVAGASVSLYEGDRLAEGTISKEDGKFVLHRGTRQSTQVSISMLGCAPMVISIKGASKSLDLGNLYLDDTHQLDEIVVTAQRENVQRILVFPKKHELVASPDVLSLLRNMGLRGLSISPMSQTALVYGKAVQWQVNGVPKSREEIFNIIPEKILRIEYSDMPGARYLDKGIGGVVNIVLKEQNDGGSFRVSAQPALTTGYFNGNTGFSYNIGKHALTLGYNLSYRNYKSRLVELDERFIGKGEEVHRVKMPVASPFGYSDHNLSLSYLYQMTPNRQFSATFSGKLLDTHSIEQSHVIETHKADYFRTDYSKGRSVAPTLDLYFSNLFDNGGKLELNVVGTYRQGKYESSVSDKMGGAVKQEYTNPVESHRKALISEVYYTQQFRPSLVFTTGVQNHLGHSENTYFSPSKFTDVLSENNNYLYAQLSGSANKFQYSVGTGVKAYWVKSSTNQKSYYKNLSTLTLMYSLSNKAHLRLASSYMPSLPSLSQLSEVSQRYDDYLVHSGNPQLSAAQYVYNRLGLYYSSEHFAHDLEATYYRIWDPILYDVSYNREKNYFLSHAVNGRYSQVLGLSWNLKMKNLWDFLTIYSTVGYDFQNSDTGVDKFSLNSLYWDISAILQYKEWSLAYYYTQPKRSLYNNVVSRGENSSQLTLIWKRNRLTLYAALHFPFTKNGATYESELLSRVNPKTSYVSILDNRNMFSLGLSWNISFGKRLKTSQRGLYNTDSDNSMVSTSSR